MVILQMVSLSNSGDPFYLRPEGYWDGGSDWTTEQVPDFSQDYLLEDPTGQSTSDLISEDGTVKTFLPPNSRSFILGPLVDGYVPNHGYDNYSNIGYIQKDTRQFVLLQEFKDSSLLTYIQMEQEFGMGLRNN